MEDPRFWYMALDNQLHFNEIALKFSFGVVDDEAGGIIAFTYTQLQALDIVNALNNK